MFKIVICPSLRKYMASQIACRFRTNSAQNWRIPTIGLLFLTVTNFQLQKQHASTLQQFQDCGNSCSTCLVGRVWHPFACPFGYGFADCMAFQNQLSSELEDPHNWASVLDCYEFSTTEATCKYVTTIS